MLSLAVGLSFVLALEPARVVLDVLTVEAVILALLFANLLGLGSG